MIEVAIGVDGRRLTDAAAMFTADNAVSVTVSTASGKLRIFVAQNQDGSDRLVLYRAPRGRGKWQKSGKWRRLYDGPMPTSKEAIFASFAEYVAKQLANGG